MIYVLRTIYWKFLNYYIYKGEIKKSFISGEIKIVVWSRKFNNGKVLI